MSFHDAMADAQSAWYSSDIADAITYNGESVYGHVTDGSERVEAGVATTSQTLYVRKSDVAQPAIDDVVVHDGIKYRVGQGFLLSGGDWIIPIIPDYAAYVEV